MQTRGQVRTFLGAFIKDFKLEEDVMMSGKIGGGLTVQAIFADAAMSSVRTHTLIPPFSAA